MQADVLLHRSNAVAAWHHKEVGQFPHICHNPALGEPYSA